jgi:LacI family transcriptional regulator
MTQARRPKGADGLSAVTTIYDVARAARVSPATVSRVVGGQVQVSPALTKRVQHAAAKLGYTPNRVARSLRRQDSSLLALIVSDIENPFFTSLVRGVDSLARGFGLSVVLFNTDEDLNQERRLLAVAAAERMAGVIFSPISERESEIGPLLRHRQPVVSIDRRLRSASIDSVTVTNVKGAEEATTHLINAGYRRVACVIGPLYTSTYGDRLRGYRQGLQRLGHSYAPELVVDGGLKEDSGYAATRRLFELRRPPDAILMTNSLQAIGALACLAELGISPGPQLGFVTFDDMPWARLVSPAVTTVAQPNFRVGEAAVTLLSKRAADPDRKIQSVILSTELRARASSVRRSAPHGA